MFSVWLVGVLALTAGPYQADGGRIKPGMTRAEVEAAIGQPSFTITVGSATILRSTSAYEQVDWLGGLWGLYVYFDENGGVEDYAKRYRPFSETPPWMDRLRVAFGLEPSDRYRYLTPNDSRPGALAAPGRIH